MIGKNYITSDNNLDIDNSVKATFTCHTEKKKKKKKMMMMKMNNVNNINNIRPVMVIAKFSLHDKIILNCFKAKLRKLAKIRASGKNAKD